MLVKSIQWISEGANEAEVEITDGRFVFFAFSQPCIVEVGDEIVEPLHVFDIKNAMISDQTDLGVWKTIENRLGHRIVAKVVDVSTQSLSVGGIQLLVDDYLPRGLESGNLIEFECARIDLW
jgi:hypothetical protein